MTTVDYPTTPASGLQDDWYEPDPQFLADDARLVSFSPLFSETLCLDLKYAYLRLLINEFCRPPREGHSLS